MNDLILLVALWAIVIIAIYFLARVIDGWNR